MWLSTCLLALFALCTYSHSRQFAFMNFHCMLAYIYINTIERMIWYRSKCWVTFYWEFGFFSTSFHSELAKLEYIKYVTPRQNKCGIECHWSNFSNIFIYAMGSVYSSNKTSFRIWEKNCTQLKETNWIGNWHYPWDPSQAPVVHI